MVIHAFLFITKKVAKTEEAKSAVPRPTETKAPHPPKTPPTLSRLAPPPNLPVSNPVLVTPAQQYLPGIPTPLSIINSANTPAMFGGHTGTFAIQNPAFQMGNVQNAQTPRLAPTSAPGTSQIF